MLSEKATQFEVSHVFLMSVVVVGGAGINKICIFVPNFVAFSENITPYKNLSLKIEKTVINLLCNYLYCPMKIVKMI